MTRREALDDWLQRSAELLDEIIPDTHNDDHGKDENS